MESSSEVRARWRWTGRGGLRASRISTSSSSSHRTSCAALRGARQGGDEKDGGWSMGCGRGRSRRASSASTQPRGAASSSPPASRWRRRSAAHPLGHLQAMDKYHRAVRGGARPPPPLRRDHQHRRPARRLRRRRRFRSTATTTTTRHRRRRRRRRRRRSGRGRRRRPPPSPGGGGGGGGARSGGARRRDHLEPLRDERTEVLEVARLDATGLSEEQLGQLLDGWPANRVMVREGRVHLI